MAFIHEGRRTTFSEFDNLTNRFARGLRATGVEGGDRILYLGKNSLDFFLTLYGAAKAGTTFVPLNWRLSPVELAAIVLSADARLAIVERESEELWEGICRAAGADIEAIFVDPARSLVAWCASFDPEPPRLHIREDDPAIILYTSGTTGRPKGVVHTHASFNHSRLSEHFEKAFDWREGDLFLNPLPNFHLLHIALSLQCLYNGVAIQFDFTSGRHGSRASACP